MNLWHYCKIAMILSIISISLFMLLFVLLGGLQQAEYTIYGTIFANLIVSWSVAFVFTHQKYQQKNKYIIAILFSTMIYALVLYFTDLFTNSMIGFMRILWVSLLNSIIVASIAVAFFKIKDRLKFFS